MLLFLQFIDERHDVGECDERTGSQYEQEHTIRIGEDGEVEDFTRTEKFTDSTENGQREGEAQAHTNTIERRESGVVLSRKRFCTTEHNTVHNDKGNEQTETCIEVGQISLHTELHDRNERSDDNDERGDAYLIRNEVLQEGDYHVGAQEHEGGSESHRHTIDSAAGSSQGRTHTEHEHHGRILAEKTVSERL